MTSAKGFWHCGTVFRRPARAQLAALPTQTPRRSGIRRRGRRAIRRACGSAPGVLSDKAFHRRSIQATRLAVGGAGRSKWRYDVGVHAIIPAIGGAQPGRTSRSASRASRPVSVSSALGGASREVPALGGLRRSHGRAVAVPDGSWPCPRILGRWCRSRVARAVQSCRADGSFWPPAVARGRRRGRGCGWIWSVAWPQSPPPTPCRPAAVRPTRAHLVRLLAAVIPLLPTGSLAPDPPLACHRPPPRWPCQAAARRRGSVWWPVAPPTRPCVAPQLPAQSTSTPSGCVPLPSRCCPPAPCPLLEPAAPPTAAGRCAGACAPPAGCSPLPAR